MQCYLQDTHGIANKCKEVAISFEEHGQLDPTFLKEQKDLIQELRNKHGVSDLSSINNFAGDLAASWDALKQERLDSNMSQNGAIHY